MCDGFCDEKISLCMEVICDEKQVARERCEGCEGCEVVHGP